VCVCVSVSVSVSVSVCVCEFVRVDLCKIVKLVPLHLLSWGLGVVPKLIQKVANLLLEAGRAARSPKVPFLDVATFRVTLTGRNQKQI
jgi:hypothetical protein